MKWPWSAVPPAAEVSRVPAVRGEPATGNANGLDAVRALLDRTTARLGADAQRHRDAFSHAWEADDIAEARRRLEAMSWEVDFLEIAAQWRAGLPTDTIPARPDDARLAVHVGTMSLCAWYRALMPPEKELALSGVEIGPGAIYLDQAIPLPGRASRAHVDPDPEGVYQALTRFAGFGYHLRAYVHSQPGTGPDATQPSARDLATQRAVERTYRAIGLIMSEDGCLRAYSDRLAFAFSVYGDNIEVIDAAQHLYRLRLP